MIGRQERKPSKVSAHTHRTTKAEQVMGNEPRIIEEFAGRVNLDMPSVRVRICSVRVDELSPPTRRSSMTAQLSSGTDLRWRRDEDDETIDICTGLFLLGGVADGLEWM